MKFKELLQLLKEDKKYYLHVYGEYTKFRFPLERGRVESNSFEISVIDAEDLSCEENKWYLSIALDAECEVSANQIKVNGVENYEYFERESSFMIDFFEITPINFKLKAS